MKYSTLRKKLCFRTIDKLINLYFTKRQKTIYELKYVYSMSQVEIADKLKISQPTVSRHLKSINRKLCIFDDIINILLAELEKIIKEETKNR